MSTKSEQSSPNWPKKWQTFCSINPTRAELDAAGFGTMRSNIYRWAARYNIAKSFEGVILHPDSNLSEKTIKMYGAVFKIFLVYSCFEHFCKISGVKMDEDGDLKTLQQQYEPAPTLLAIRGLDQPGYDFFSFVAERLDPRPAARMQSFIQGNSCNVSFIGKAIRHLFAHGNLAATSGQMVIGRRKKLEDLLTKFLFKVMDAEFSSKMTALENNRNNTI